MDETEAPGPGHRGRRRGPGDVRVHHYGWKHSRPVLALSLLAPAVVAADKILQLRRQNKAGPAVEASI